MKPNENSWHIPPPLMDGGAHINLRKCWVEEIAEGKMSRLFDSVFALFPIVRQNRAGQKNSGAVALRGRRRKPKSGVG